MQSLRRIVAILCLVIIAGLGVAAWNISLVKNPTDAVQVNRDPGGDVGITVSATRASDKLLEQPGIGPDLAGMKGHVLPFAVALDTHSGDISDLDLTGKLFLRDSAGVEIPGMVKQLSADEHHVAYVAVFPKEDSYGKPLDAPSQQHLELLVKGVGGQAVRLLRWNLNTTPEGNPDLSGTRRLVAGFIGLAAVLGGFLALLSPCVLHTTWYWAGLVAAASTKEEVEQNRLPILRAGVVKAVLLFIGGFTTMYVSLGTAAGAIGSIASQTLTTRLDPYKLVLDVVAGLFMILFGLHVTGLLDQKWIHRLKLPLPRTLQTKLQGSARPTAFTMGLSMGLGCVACVGGTVFLGLLAYLGTTTWYTGLQVSLLYSLGVALPLLLLTLGLDRWLKAMRSSVLLRKSMAYASGAMLVVIGALTMVGRSELAEAGIFWAVARLGIHLPGSLGR